MLAIGAVGLLAAGAQMVPPLKNYPEAWEVNLAPALNAAVDWLTVTFFPVTQAIKDWTVFYLLQPLRIGFAQAVRPATWGFDLSALVIAACRGQRGSGRAGRMVRLAPRRGDGVRRHAYYFGTTGLPLGRSSCCWPARLRYRSADGGWGCSRSAGSCLQGWPASGSRQ